MSWRYRRPRLPRRQFIDFVTVLRTEPVTWAGLSTPRASYAGTGVLHSIEHPVYDNSSHGNIEPDRKSPAGDAPVCVEAFSKGPKERDQSQRYNRRCQNGVREKNREIDQPDTSLPFEWNGAHLVVVDKIRNQEKNRASESREHARFVRLDVSRFDEQVSTDQQNGAE